jgi:hypothetical protein
MLCAASDRINAQTEILQRLGDPDANVYRRSSFIGDGRNGWIACPCCSMIRIGLRMF